MDEVSRRVMQVLHDDPGLPERVRKAQEETWEQERKVGLPEGWQAEFFPKVMTVDWKPVEQADEAVTWDRRDGLRVIATASLYDDGRRWLHVSCSRRNNLPTYRDLKEVKRLFIGKDRSAIQIFPSESKHVDIHPYCLHMFCCLDGDALPDFTKGTGSL